MVLKTDRFKVEMARNIKDFNELGNEIREMVAGRQEINIKIGKWQRKGE